MTADVLNGLHLGLLKIGINLDIGGYWSVTDLGGCWSVTDHVSDIIIVKCILIKYYCVSTPPILYPRKVIKLEYQNQMNCNYKVQNT